MKTYDSLMTLKHSLKNDALPDEFIYKKKKFKNTYYDLEGKLMIFEQNNPGLYLRIITSDRYKSKKDLEIEEIFN